MDSITEDLETGYGPLPTTSKMKSEPSLMNGKAPSVPADTSATEEIEGSSFDKESETPAPVAEEIDTSYKSPVKAMREKLRSAKALANPEPTVEKLDFIVFPENAFNLRQLDIGTGFKLGVYPKHLSTDCSSYDPKIEYHTFSSQLQPGVLNHTAVNDLCSINRISQLHKGRQGGKFDFSFVAIKSGINSGFTTGYYVIDLGVGVVYTEELHDKMNLSWKSHPEILTVRGFISWIGEFIPSSCLSTIPKACMPLDYFKKAHAPVSENCGPKTLISTLTEVPLLPLLPPILNLQFRDLCGIPRNYDTFRTESDFAGFNTPLDEPTNFIRQEIHFEMFKPRKPTEITVWTNPLHESDDIDFSSRIVEYSAEDRGIIYIQKRNTFLLKSKVTGFSRYTYDQPMHVYFNDQWKSLELNKPRTLSEYKKWTDLTLQKYLSETNSEFST
jgi:hypothetical protein